MPGQAVVGESVTLTMTPASTVSSPALRRPAPWRGCPDVEAPDGSPAFTVIPWAGTKYWPSAFVDENVQAAVALERGIDGSLPVANIPRDGRYRAADPSPAKSSTSCRRRAMTTSAPQRTSSAAVSLPRPVPPPMTSAMRLASMWGRRWPRARRHGVSVYVPAGVMSSSEQQVH